MKKILSVIIVLIFAVGFSSVSAEINGNLRTSKMTEKNALKTIERISNTDSLKYVTDLFNGGFKSSFHPAGWELFEKTDSPPFKKIVIKVISDNSAKYEDVDLILQDGITIEEKDIIKIYGKIFNHLPMKPDNFDEHTIFYNVNRKTQIFFTFSSAKNNQLTEIMIRKLRW
jgi:hypothetical protein